MCHLIIYVSILFALFFKFNFAFTEPFLLRDGTQHSNKNEIIKLAMECFTNSKCIDFEFEKCFVSSWQVADNNIQTSITRGNFSDRYFNDNLLTVNREYHYQFDSVNMSLRAHQTELLDNHSRNLGSVHINENRAKETDSTLHSLSDSSRQDLAGTLDGSYSCPSFSASDTDSAQRNFVVCNITACPGSTITASVCDSYDGDTYLRLFEGDTQVEENDEYCRDGSYLTYTVTGSICRVFSLRQGCYMSEACSGTSQMTGLLVTATPSSQPTGRSTSQPTVSSAPTLSSSPTNTPSTFPTSTPTEAPDVVHVDDLTDSRSLGSAASCEPNHVAGSCNLRSAVEYCVSVSSRRYCEIHLPVESAVVLDSQWDHMRVTGRIQPGAQFLSVVGHGSTLSLMKRQNARGWLVMQVDASSAKPFSLELQDLTIQGFFGAFSLVGVQSFKCSSVNFLDNYAYGDGGALYIRGVTSLIIINSVFANNAAGNFGGAVYVDTVLASARISGSTFRSNTGLSGSSCGGALYLIRAPSISLTNCEVISNTVLHSGGGVYIEFSNHATVADTLFRSNSAVWGGAVRMLSCSYASFLNTSFDGNIAVRGSDGYGGALFLNGDDHLIMTDCKFTRNEAAYGGGINMGDCNYVLITGSLFSSNGGTLGPGGGVLSYSSHYLTIVNTLFDGNIAHLNNGGALYLNANDHFAMTGCGVVNNMAQYGGGLFIEAISDIAIVETIFDSNQAFGKSSEESNSRVFGGGALVVYSSDHLSVTNCEVTNNWASDDGGGIHIYSAIPGGSFITVAGTIFDSNSASAGGALHVTKFSHLTITNCHIVNNLALSDGGGMMFHSNTAFVHIARSKFSHNSAVSGGGVFLSSLNFNFRVENSYFELNEADYGAGIYFGMLNAINISNSIFLQNLATVQGGGVYLNLNNNNCLVNNVSFLSNMSPEGAGVYSNRNSALTIVDSLFESNNASFFGGGVFLNSNNNNFKIRNCRFKSNLALVSGGAIYIYSGNDCLSTNYAAISSCLFSNNFCLLTGGGAIAFMFENKLRISDNTFVNNSAHDGGSIFSFFKNDLWFSNLYMSFNKATNGGAFSIGQQDTVSISDCNISFNSAQNNGGGLFASLLSSVDISNTSLLNNHADYLGGAIYYESDNLKFVFSFANNNSGGRGGGGMYVKGSSIQIIESTFISNNVLGSTGSGGAIFFDESSNVLILHNKVHDNFAADKGALMFRSCFDVTIQKNTISRNRALLGGGTAVMENSRNINLTENVYSSNVATADGGGVYVEGSSAVQLSRLLFMNNAAYSGGGLYVETSEKIMVDTCSFESNDARQYGGGAVIKQSVSVSLLNSNVLSNVASVDGGGVYVEGSSAVQLNRLLFMNNAAYSGGGLYVETSEKIIVDTCSFESNDALQYGGGAVIKQSVSVSLLNSKVSSNVASVDGGGFSLLEVDTASLLDNHFERNIATTGSGSAIWLASSPSMILRENYFSSNEALLGGGAVHWVYSKNMLSEPQGLSEKQSNTFLGNRALYGKDFSSTGSSISCRRGGDNTWTEELTELIYNYDNNLVPINITVRDFYSQLYPLANSHFVEAQIINTSCNSNPYPQIVGETITRFSDGLAIMDSIKPTCNPDGFFTLQLLTTMPYSNDIQASCNIRIDFRRCVLGEIYSASYACTPCPSGLYSLVTPIPDTQCLKCPEDASECSGNQIILPNNYWRQSGNNSKIYSCVEGSTFCKGGDKVGDESCEVGHKGLLCEECWDDYYYDNTYEKCKPCEGSSLNVVAIVLVSVLGAFVLCFLLYYILQLLDLDLLRSADFSFSTLLYLFYLKVFASKDETGKIEFKEKYLELYDRFATKFKVYFSLYQILSNMKSNLSVDYTGVYRSLMNWVKPVMSPFRLQSISSLGLSCSYDRLDYVDSLLIVTLAPIFISILFGLIYVSHYYYLSSYKKCNIQELSSLYSNYLFIFLVGSYVILPGLCASIFQAFACQEFEQGFFLRADLTISCESARYKEGIAIGVVMIIVYVVGVPLMYFSLLYRHLDDIERRNDPDYMTPEKEESIRPYKFLYASYEPQYWYWEVVETYRRLILSGLIVVLVNLGGSMQIVLSLLVTLLFIKLYAYYEPFEDDYIDVDGEFAQYQLFIILFVTLLIKEDVFDSYWLDVVICVVALSMFLLSPCRWWSERGQERMYNQKYLDNAKNVRHGSFVFRERDIFRGGDVTMSLQPVGLDSNDLARRQFFEQYGVVASSPSVVGNTHQSLTDSRDLSSLSARNINIDSDDDASNSDKSINGSGDCVVHKMASDQNDKSVEKGLSQISSIGKVSVDDDIESNKTNNAIRSASDFQLQYFDDDNFVQL